MMKRFDWERYENAFRVFDRRLSRKIATAYDVADAEMICKALNELEATKHERDNDV